MENNPMRFTLDGFEYRIDSHIWTAYPDRVGLVTVERIVETIREPDFQEIESEYVTYFWKWFHEMGTEGNFLKVIVNARLEIRLVSTAHPDENFRKRQRAHG